MRARLSKWFLGRKLAEMRDWCQGRIDRGDLDLDDYIYKTRDACTYLIDQWFPAESKEQPK